MLKLLNTHSYPWLSKPVPHIHLLQRNTCICSQEGTHKNIISAWLVLEKRKLHTCPSVGEWLNKRWYILIMDAVILYKLPGREGTPGNVKWKNKLQNDAVMGNFMWHPG